MTKQEAIERCREAIDSDDMLSVATRDDFAELLGAYETVAECLRRVLRYEVQHRSTCCSSDPEFCTCGASKAMRAAADAVLDSGWL